VENIFTRGGITATQVKKEGLSGRELILATLRHEGGLPIPWVPFAGVHAGQLRGFSAREVLTDADKLETALLAVNALYQPDGQPVLFDLQLEAEMLGCRLLWSDVAPPSVVSHPLEGTDQLPERLPGPDEGRLPLVLDVMRRLKRKIGERTALYGLVCGPLTLASHLRGTEIFMDMIRQPKYVQDLVEYCREAIDRIAGYYTQEGWMDVIAIVDPLVSQISPRHFAELVAPACIELFDRIRAWHVFSSFFVCGDATRNIELMCKTRPDSIAVDENIDLPAAKHITDAANVVIEGNIPLTTCMLYGSQADNLHFVRSLVQSLTPGNFILSPGCDMPYATPVENVNAVIEAVRDAAAADRMLENYQAVERNIPVELPDYEHLPQPLVEVFTLDSDTCPACGYMLRAAQNAVRKFGKADLAEYKFTEPANAARMKKLGVSKLPSILINGQVKYASLIPGEAELLEALAAVTKGRP
jgi:uroporphyrinogen decarboxylase